MATELPERQRFYKNDAILKQMMLLLQTKLYIMSKTFWQVHVCLTKPEKMKVIQLFKYRLPW